MRFPTRIVGDLTAVQQLAIPNPTGIVRLARVDAYNNSAGALFIQIFENSTPTGTPKYSFPAAITSFMAPFIPPSPIDMVNCCIAASTTAMTYSAAGAGTVNITALIAT